MGCRRRQRLKAQGRDQLVDRSRTDRLAAGGTVGRRGLTLQGKGASNGVAAALAEDAVLAIQGAIVIARSLDDNAVFDRAMKRIGTRRSEEHTSELQSLMRISYAVFCLKKKKDTHRISEQQNTYQMHIV